jgi:glutathione-regulated potassium-efflux system ancillary protein KefC
MLALSGINRSQWRAAMAGHRTLSALKVVAVIFRVIVGGRLLLRPLLRWIANSGA